MFKSIYRPDVTVNQYKKSIQVKLGGLRPLPGKSVGRGCISGRSCKSQNRMRLVLEEIQYVIVNMIRLSYPQEFPWNGKQVAKHRDTFLKRLRRRGIKYFWWLEFQQRGAPHLHLYIDQDIDKKDLAKWWFDIVGCDDLNHLAYGTRIERVRSCDDAIGYAMSYVKKKTQVAVPEGFESPGRFWGTSEKVKASGEYKLKFKTENERGRWFRVFRKWYQAKLRAVGIEKMGRPYKWKMRKDQGFMAWSGREAWEQFIAYKIKDGGLINHVESEHE